MKKLFTMLVLMMLCIVGTKAQDEVIFSADVTATDKVSFEPGTTEITSTNAEIVGGKMYAINGQDGAKELIGKQSSYYMFCMTNNNTCFKVELDKALAVGDVISAKTYTRTDTNLGLFISTATPRPNECSTKLSIDKAETAGYESLSDYTIKEGDGLVGETTFYIYREVGKSTYFNEFTITRATKVVTNKTIFLVPGIWDDADATERYAAYVWAEGVEANWKPFTEVGGVLATTIPDTYAKLILVRMNGESTENNWDNVWNQTEDIDFTTVADQTIFTITGFSDSPSGKSGYTTSNPLQEAKDKLNKLIAMAETLDATTLATQIAAAKTAAEGTDIGAMQTAANNLFDAAVPVANEVLAKAEEFATKYGYTDVTTAINNVRAAIPTDASGDLDNLQAALNALSAVALPAAQDAVGKIESYAEALDDEALNAAVATAKTALGTGNFKAILAALKAAETPFITAAQAYVTKVQGENIDDINVKNALAALAEALGAEQPNIVTVGNAVKALVDAYNAYQLEQNPVYTVAGTTDLTGYNWDATKNEMTLNTETGLYEWTAEFITVNSSQKPEFKIVKNYKNWYPEGDNWVITPDVLGGEGIYNITITFNAETEEIGVTGTKFEFADNNVYFWQSPYGEAYENGGTAVHSGSDTNRVNYKDVYYTICLNGKNDFSSDVVTITLNDGNTLKAGDEIAITAYRNKDATDKSSGAKLKFDKTDETITTGGGTEFVNINAAVEGTAEYGTEPNTVIITVPDAADGSKTITMTRSYTSTNLYITKIDITRPEADFAYCVVTPDGDVYVNDQVMEENEGVFTATLENMAGKFFAIAPKAALNATGQVTDWSKVVRPTSDYDFWVEYFINYEDVTQSLNEGGKVWHVADNNSSKLTLTYTPADNKFTITTDAVMNVTISEAGYATYSNTGAYKVSGENVKTYVVTGTTTKLQMQQLADGFVIPGGTGVVLEGTGNVTITPRALTEDIGTIETNYLIGSGNYTYNISGKYPDDSSYTAYILAKKDKGVGFYLFDDSAGNDIPAHKAFLAVPGTNAAPFFGFADAETTGINSLTPTLSEGEGVYYTLDGRRVENPTKGLYIVNGKKVLVP